MPGYSERWISDHLTPTIVTNRSYYPERIFLQAPYNADLNAKYKELRGYWNPTDKAWEFPAKALSKLRELLTANGPVYEINMAGFGPEYESAVMRDHIHDAAIYWMLPLSGTIELEQITTSDPDYRPFADRVGAALNRTYLRQLVNADGKRLLDELDVLADECWELAKRQGPAAATSVYGRLGGIGNNLKMATSLVKALERKAAAEAAN